MGMNSRNNPVWLSVIFLSIVLFFLSCASTLSFDERFAREVKRMEKDYINYEEDGIKCVDFSVEGKVITIKYVTLNYSADQINPVAFANAFKEYTLSHACRDRDIRYLLKNGVAFKYQYFSNDQIHFNETVMDRILCGYE